MSATEFIKEFGWEESIRIYNNLREIVNQTPYKHSLEDFSIELKPYIEAYELVQTSYPETLYKAHIEEGIWSNRELQQAISLVEGIEC